jgi:hypothetical protein
MTVTELIAALQEARRTHGDREVTLIVDEEEYYIERVRTWRLHEVTGVEIRNDREV